MTAADWLTGLGLLFTCCGLFYNARQLRLARKVARAEFFFNLDPVFREHAAVEAKLRGEWQGSGPTSLEEWLAVEEYMGLYERIQVMVDDGIVDLDSFHKIYGYKLFYLVNNKMIHSHKLVARASHWVLFIKLWRSLEALKEDPELYPGGSPALGTSTTSFSTDARLAQRSAEQGAAPGG